MLTAHALHQCVPALIPGLYDIRGLIQFVGCLLHFERFFFEYYGFPTHQKATFDLNDFILSVLIVWPFGRALLLG